MAITLTASDMFGLDALQQASLERIVKYIEAADAAGATSFPNIPEDMLFAFGRDEKRAVHAALKYAWENQSNFGNLDNSLVYQGFGGAVLNGVSKLVDTQLRAGELGLSDNRNLFTFTEAIENAAWPKFFLTATANQITAPDGTLTADKLTVNQASQFPNLDRALPALLANEWYTMSTHVKLGSPANGVELQFFLSDAGFTDIHSATTSYHPKSNGITYRGDLPREHGVLNLPNGWTRIYVAAQMPANMAPYTTKSCIMYYDSFVGEPALNDFFHVWGWQLELGRVPTSYQRVDATPVG